MGGCGVQRSRGATPMSPQLSPAAFGVKDPNARILTTELHLQTLGKCNILKDVKSQEELWGLWESPEPWGQCSLGGAVREGRQVRSAICMAAALDLHTTPPPSWCAGHGRRGDGACRSKKAASL